MVEEKVEAQFRAVLHVDPTRGDDRATGDPAAPLKTLTVALQQSAPGTVIHLSSGAYTIESGEVFPLTIGAEVTVVGDPASRGRGITLVGSGKFDSPTFACQAVTLLMNGNAQLRGVTITNPVAKGTGIWIESAESKAEQTITSCTLRQCGREGIFVTGTAKPAVANCMFQGNLAGLAFVRNAKGEVRRCVAVDNGLGIVVSDRAAPLIIDSQFAENLVGVKLSGSASPVLRRNAIECNTGEGLVMLGAAQPDLGHPEDGAGNRLRNNGRCDLENQTALALVSVGNLLNPTRVIGAVEFPTLQKLARPGWRSHPAAPKAHPAWATPFIQAWVTSHIIADPAVTHPNQENSFQATAKLSRAAYQEMLSRALGSQVNAQVLQSLHSEAVLTRLEAIVALTQILDLSPGYPGLLSVYYDRAQIPSQNVTAIAAATQNRLVVLSPQVDRLKPLAPITQAEAAAMIYQVLVMQGKVKAIASPQIVNPSALAAFSDTQGHWAKAWIQSAVSQGWLTGDNDGRFNPDAPMSVGEYVAAVKRCFNLAFQPADRSEISRLQVWQSCVEAIRQSELPAANFALLDRYTDAPVSESDRETIALATQFRLVINYPQLCQLNLYQSATRAEVAAIGYQALIQLRSCATIASPYLIEPDQPDQLQPRDVPRAVVLQTNVPPANLQSSLQLSLQSSLQSGLPAAEIVWAIAQEIISLLQFQGIEAFLGRSADIPTAALSISLQMAIPEMAVPNPAFPDIRSEVNGIAVSYPADSLESARLSQLIHKTILRRIDTRSYGVQPEESSPALTTVVPATVPMSCITVGFVTGTEDAINLSNAEYRRCMARAIAEGILHYIQK